MRGAFSAALIRLATSNSDVLLLTGDHGYELFDDFRKACPKQYINAGIAEQNMVGMAAGLSRVGFRPFIYGLSAFVPLRVLEQIKIDVAHDALPVVFIGDGAGFVYSHLGTSHQATEDIACARVISGLAVYSPADRFEMDACMQLAYDTVGPVYLRMGKSDRGDVHTTHQRPDVRSPLCVRPGVSRDIAFVATGSLVRSAMEIAAVHFPEASVWSVPLIKPIDSRAVAQLCASTRVIVVMEEHSVLGGLGSVIAEIATERSPTRVLRLGVQDRFSGRCGTYEYLLKEHGLDQASLLKQIKQFLSPAT
jgi:transketolase